VQKPNESKLHTVKKKGKIPKQTELSWCTFCEHTFRDLQWPVRPHTPHIWFYC